MYFVSRNRFSNCRSIPPSTPSRLVRVLLPVAFGRELPELNSVAARRRTRHSASARHVWLCGRSQLWDGGPRRTHFCDSGHTFSGDDKRTLNGIGNRDTGGTQAIDFRAVYPGRGRATIEQLLRRSARGTCPTVYPRCHPGSRETHPRIRP